MYIVSQQLVIYTRIKRLGDFYGYQLRLPTNVSLILCTFSNVHVNNSAVLV